MDELLFADEEESLVEEAVVPPWNILIVDDEEGIHEVTTLILKRFEFVGRSLHFLHAYSAKEALELLGRHDDIALILLDVVMESEQAGLDMIRVVRNEMRNLAVRIVLRTGQPGMAPEQKVICKYDINDYKSKSELTAGKLTTLLYSTLRAYRDIITLQKSKRGLEKLIVASRGISSRGALGHFINVTMQQMVTLLNLDDTSLFTCETKAFALKETYIDVYSPDGGLGGVERIKLNALPGGKKEILQEAINKRTNIFHANRLVMYCSNRDITILFFAQINLPLSELDINLLNIFTENLIVILENIHLNELITGSQKEIIYRLGEVVESRSSETGYHIKRVAHYSELLATLVGLSREEAELIKTASPMHDIGKIGISDAILTKPGKLDADEWREIQTHCQRGYDILSGSNLMVMKISAIIALSHHEKWDGTGYPRGLKGDEIHIYGRITALADVLDVLGSDRCYKKAWPLSEILALIEAERGRHFDPRLVDLFLKNLDAFLAIKESISGE